MVDRRTLLLASLAALLPAGVATASARRPSPQTLDYGPAKLDIYAPDDASGLPVVFFVHGGTWQFGKRSQVGAKPAFLLANGFCFVSIDYRMLPEADVATQAGDRGLRIGLVRGQSSAAVNTAASAPTPCAPRNAGTSPGVIPANVSDKERAIVTAGLAKDVEAVNQ